MCTRAVIHSLIYWLLFDALRTALLPESRKHSETIFIEFVVDFELYMLLQHNYYICFEI